MSIIKTLIGGKITIIAKIKETDEHPVVIFVVDYLGPDPQISVTHISKPEHVRQFSEYMARIALTLAETKEEDNEKS